MKKFPLLSHYCGLQIVGEVLKKCLSQGSGVGQDHQGMAGERRPIGWVNVGEGIGTVAAAFIKGLAPAGDGVRRRVDLQDHGLSLPVQELQRLLSQAAAPELGQSAEVLHIEKLRRLPAEEQPGPLLSLKQQLKAVGGIRQNGGLRDGEPLLVKLAA